MGPLLDLMHQLLSHVLPIDVHPNPSLTCNPLGRTHLCYEAGSRHYDLPLLLRLLGAQKYVRELKYRQVVLKVGGARGWMCYK